MSGGNFTNLKRQWNMMYDSIKQKQVEFSRQFVMENPFSMASVMAVYQKFDENEYIIKDLHTLRVAASALNTIYPNSGHVKALYQNTLIC
jgi:CRISPR/Cas system-associated protein endoribonuclease Cas2